MTALYAEKALRLKRANQATRPPGHSRFTSDPILSPAEACEELGISKATWQRHWRPQVEVVHLSPKRIGVRLSALQSLAKARAEGGGG
jgi:hypothetical protein